MKLTVIEETLKQSEKKYSALFEGANDAIFLMDEQVFLECNQKTLDMFGCTEKGDIISHPPWEFSPPRQPDNQDSKESAHAYIQAALDGTPQRFYWQHMKKDGTLFDAEVSLNRIDLGSKVFLQAIVRDITAYKDSEKALQKSEEQFRSLYENVTIGLYRTTPEGQILLANPTLVYLLGFTSFEELAQRNIEKEGFEEGYTRMDFRQKLEQEGSIKGMESMWVKKDGSCLYIRENATVRRDSDGNILYYEGTIEDITERKLTELKLARQTEELQELNAAKDKFFSIIAHDLKSPFTSIVGFSELLLEQIHEKNYQVVEKYAGIVLNSSLRVMELLKNLLEWSRSQTGRIENIPEYIELTSLIHDAITLSEAPARHKSITIKSALPDSTIIFADKSMLSTIMRNLLSNAIKFTHPGGTIVVSAEQLKQECRISVSDNGIGIRKEEATKIFSIAESYSTPGTQKETGTGLGLILCKEFVEQQGGRIGVDSEPGKGSCFWFIVPTEPSSAVLPHPSK